MTILTRILQVGDSWLLVSFVTMINVHPVVVMDQTNLLFHICLTVHSAKTKVPGSNPTASHSSFCSIRFYFVEIFERCWG